MHNTRNQIITGIKWNFIGQFSRQGIYFFISIILARLLAPEEFGLIAMLSVFIGIAEAFIHSGLGAGLVHRDDVTEKEYATVFYFNLTTSVLFYILLFYLGPFIAKLYNQPILEKITYYLSFVFIINAIGMVPSFILVKNLEFKKLNIISLLSVTISAPVAVFMAYKGSGVFSLVAQTIIYALANCFLLYLFTNWYPKDRFSIASFKKLFRFGSNVLVSYILERIFKNLDSLLIGKVFSPNILGYFIRAKTTRDLSIDNTSSILTNIVFPIFSKINDKDELVRIHLKFYRLVAYIIFPLMIGLLLVAKPLIIVLFSDKWIPCIFYFKILCLAGTLIPLTIILQQTLMSRGRSDLVLRIDIINKSLYVLSVLSGILFGMTYVLYFILLSTIITHFYALIISKNLLEISIRKYFFEIRYSIIVTIAMLIIVSLLSTVNFYSFYIELIILPLAGISTYIYLSHVFKVDDYIYLRDMVLLKLKDLTLKNKI